MTSPTRAVTMPSSVLYFPFEIILLQTTRKENYRKTEETEKAAVTLETNGSKGPILDVYDDMLTSGRFYP